MTHDQPPLSLNKLLQIKDKSIVCKVLVHIFFEFVIYEILNVKFKVLIRGGTTRSRERIELYSEAISKGSTNLLYIN